MLRFLSIRRLAVIEAVAVEFGPGLNVLTGETGAGKSILVGAVGLLLGGRASGDLVRSGEETAIVEAVFDDRGSERHLRRDVTAQGRSRAFIDGDLATASALKDLSSRLVEMHGQHEHQTLLDPTTHLDLLDQFAGLQRLREGTAEAFARLETSNAEIAHLRRLLAERESRLELARFQLAELDKADPKPGEDDELLAARLVLASAGRLEQLCSEGYALLYENDPSILGGLSTVWRRVDELAAIDPQFRPYMETRDAIKSQLEDLALFLRRYGEGVDASPARLQQVEDRLAVLERVKRRFGPELKDAIARREALRAELAQMENGEERLAEAERARSASSAAFLESALALSAARRAAAAPFAQALETLLAELAMEQARVEMRFAPSEDGGTPPEARWTAAGVDSAEFFLSPNPGEELRPLARIVSGGELSRVMLALKTLLAGGAYGPDGDGGALSDRIPDRPRSAPQGLIFDEVDAGIGGRTADVVGRKLQALGAAFQVLCITHVPQIAAHADAHFLIEKQVIEGRTHTSVKRLDDDGRVEELARMLGGATVTSSIRDSAREMLRQRTRPPREEAKGEMNTKGESESRPRAKAKAQGKSPRKAQA
ncbi:MAG: DNA repair protein RecN [Vicinamibacterales bacterium]